MFVKLLDRRTRIRVVAISHDMALVYPGKGLEDFRMHSGIIVAGKAAPGLDGDRFHPKQCSRVAKATGAEATLAMQVLSSFHSSGGEISSPQLILRLSIPAEPLLAGGKG